MIYVYICPVCASTREIIKPLARIDEREECIRCGSPMNRQICAPAVRADYVGYSCPVTGNWIEGRKQHNENLRKHGCRILESGEREANLRRRKDDERAFDAKIERTAAEFVESLPPEKKERLAGELDKGIDVQVTRSAPSIT